MLILDGRLLSGTGLPAERELADGLGVSRTLVAAAWETLRADGLVASRRGSGSWVTLPTGPAAIPADDPFGRLAPTHGPCERSGPDGYSHNMIDFARAVPEAVPGIATAVAAAQPRLAAELSGNGYYELGLPELRQRIAERFTARGLPTTADQVLVTNGSHHVLAMALRMLTGPGDRVLIEQPTYPNAIDAIRAAHAIPVPVAMTDDGWDLDGIEVALRQAAPRLAYLVVDFQNPTGFRLDEAGRARLGAALKRTRTPVVVDETHAELDLDGEPLSGPRPLAVFAPDWVIVAGSASKSHWGGLRLGWVRASTEIISRLGIARRSLDLGSPVFEQLVLAELLRDPEPVLRERRAQAVRRREVLVEALHTYCPQWTFTVPGGGLSIWCRLPAPVSSRLTVTAQNFGVWVVPASRFAAQGGLERWLRVPYTQPEERLVDGVRRLSLAAAVVFEAGASGAGRPALDPV
jgi:DNA-binding transcriptional MocR family regulator